MTAQDLIALGLALACGLWVGRRWLSPFFAATSERGCDPEEGSLLDIEPPSRDQN